ncbi:MAG: hypothetical protein HY673_25690 [Chloroflexi bacterium]|nr:hypothetical protein [Chloroflexota bacterium]
MTRYCIEIEKEGIPTVVMGYPEFATIIGKIAELENIPALRFAVRKGTARRFNWETFSREDLAEELSRALTGPSDSSTARCETGGATGEPTLAFAGGSPGEVMEAVNQEFNKRHWSDGLPIVPPTEERIQWMLRGTDLPPDYEIGVIEPRKGIATVRTIATNAVMAGARPEYLPVILSTVEAIADHRFFYAGVQATVYSGAEMVIISGPVARAIGVHSGAGLLGPGWRPNFSIGRTLRLVGINVGQAWPDVNKMAPYVSAGRTGSWVFTEAVEFLPAGWDPLHVELGYAPEESTVTIMFLDELTSGHTVEDRCSIEAFAGEMLRNEGSSRHRLNCESLLIISPPCAAHMARKGFTKEDIRREVYAKIQVPLAPSGGHHKHWRYLPEWIQKKKPGDPVPVHIEKPADLVITVAGGTAGSIPRGMFISGWGFGSRMVTKAIDKYIPKSWEKLLKEANTNAVNSCTLTRSGV